MEKGVPVRLISRTLDVLKTINRHGGLTMTEISRDCDLAYATTCRIVQTLVHEGIIELEPGRKVYRPTGLVQMLSYGYQYKNAFAALARPHMTTLTKKVGWPCVLCNRVSDSMVITDTTHSLTTMTFSEYHPGYAIPIWATASGMVYLAYCSDEEYQSVLQVMLRDTENFKKTWMIGEENLERARAEILQKGYATYARTPHSLDPGKTSGIAVPLFRNGTLAGTLALVFFSSTHTTEEAAEKYFDDLVETQRAIAEDPIQIKSLEYHMMRN